MELQKIRNLSDEELTHHKKVTADQLFRLRFQVSMGQNDGVKKLRQLRKEIAQIKTVARERELGIHGETAEAEEAAPDAPVADKPKRTRKPAAVKRAVARTRKPAAAKTRKAAAAKKTKGAGK